MSAGQNSCHSEPQSESCRDNVLGKNMIPAKNKRIEKLGDSEVMVTTQFSFVNKV
jgi:hypothetical protein